MVKLPGTSEQQGRAVGERGSERPMGTRSHHQWGARFGRRRAEMSQRGEPKTLLELEELAKRSKELMEKYNSKSENNFDKAMDLLRMQYNLNFMIICEKCGGPHARDEISAPER